MSDEIDIAALRKAAQRATPGPWGVAYHRDRLAEERAGVKALGALYWLCSMQASNQPGWDRDAEYIATANPAVILALLDRLERAEAAAEMGKQQK